ncbi:nitrate reductase associated protein [Acidocella sp. KAb 2-4]|uniref:nitrate reductase associated protein n=1 Tax=Acidocella sp. KAb 2-4 TaxID=2885158 RepID=UPI001D08364E|nr:nitrate reductase associated protein [Acidocella sp. KAb 2-4]MCB5944720.1 nitrate reductase associated protein [Acidocella sp. KAb 2-4]
MAFDSVFAFEQDFAGSLRCIPMAVRYKLDLCGVKLSLRQWSHFTEEDRHALLHRACETADEAAQYRAALESLIAQRSGESASFLPVEPAPAWADTSRVPAQVADYAQSLGVAAPSPAQWAGLSALQRFTLIKLSRESHDNVNFIPALREFGLQA